MFAHFCPFALRPGSLILVTSCHATWGWLAQAKCLEAFLRGWRSDNAFLRRIGVWAIAVAVSVHIYSVLLPSAVDNFKVDVLEPKGISWPAEVSPPAPPHFRCQTGLPVSRWRMLSGFYLSKPRFPHVTGAQRALSHAQKFVHFGSLPPAIDPLPLSPRSFSQLISPYPRLPARWTQLTPSNIEARVDVDAEVVTWTPDDLVSLLWVSVVLALFALLLAWRLCLPRSSWSDYGGGIHGASALLWRWLKPVRRPSR